MSAEIQHGKLSIREIFERWYQIPEYQRSYVWDTDQVQDLLQDIYDSFQRNKSAEYFLGSMVLKINQKAEQGVEYKEYEILDGQQRLTTIFLLFAVFRDLAIAQEKTAGSSKKYAQMIDACKGAIFQEANDLQGNPERMRIIFRIRSKIQEFVDNYVKEDTGTEKQEELLKINENKYEIESIRHMANTIMVARNFFENHDTELYEYFLYFYTKVQMIYVATEELQDAFQMFTVLNNRGIKLSNSDILKAENLRAISASAQDRKYYTDYARKWEEMENYFGEDFDQFLSLIRTILVKKKAMYGLLKEFEENVYSSKVYDRTAKAYISQTPLLARGKQTFDYIDEFYKYYTELLDQSNVEAGNDYTIDNYICLMQIGLTADYWIAPLLDYRKKHGKVKLKEFVRAIDKKVSADWIIGLSPTERIENVNAILREIEKSKTSDEILSSSAMQINLSELKRVLEGDIYGKHYARYIMLKLDLLYHGNTTKFDPPVTISVEHILPQTPDANSQWKKDFSEQELEEWTDKLGNLTLLSRRKNASQGNLDYKIKMEKYFKGNIELFSNSIRIYKEYAQWTPAEVEKNQKESIAKLEKEY